jgi:hypothetical protein
MVALVTFETVAPVVSPLIGGITVSTVLDVLVLKFHVDPLLFALELLLLDALWGGGLTILESLLPLLKCMHY